MTSDTIARMTLSPARIMEIGMGFWPAKVLLSAVEIGVFTTLGDRALTGAELQHALGLHARANPDCRDAGFTRFEIIHLAGPASAGVAYK